jgi:predicted  nucleic acid-binding Zn-ribbon protein
MAKTPPKKASSKKETEAEKSKGKKAEVHGKSKSNPMVAIDPTKIAANMEAKSSAGTLLSKVAKKSIAEVVKSTAGKPLTKIVKEPNEVRKEEKEVKKEVKEAKETSKTEKVSVSHSEDSTDVSIEKKLVALFNLQQVDSEINKIRIVRGELPLEVQDLEDEIAGLETRINNLQAEVEGLEANIKEKKLGIKECLALIKKYETQQGNVRNNREFDSISKEIEFQNLEIQLCEKRIKEFGVAMDAKKQAVASAKSTLNERLDDLKQKKVELEEIVSETEKEENRLLKKFQDNQRFIEDRLITAYQRIKKNARNGLAVVLVERDACGGCFNKIPPQRQLDIKMHKKIIVCEYCGRILIDSSIEEMSTEK